MTVRPSRPLSERKEIICNAIAGGAGLRWGARNGEADEAGLKFIPAPRWTNRPKRARGERVHRPSGRFRIILQVDGYTGYHKLAVRIDVRPAFCWSLVPRGFYSRLQALVDRKRSSPARCRAIEKGIRDRQSVSLRRPDGLHGRQRHPAFHANVVLANAAQRSFAKLTKPRLSLRLGRRPSGSHQSLRHRTQYQEEAAMLAVGRSASPRIWSDEQKRTDSTRLGWQVL